jgi:hypothetical protein
LRVSQIADRVRSLSWADVEPVAEAATRSATNAGAWSADVHAGWAGDAAARIRAACRVVADGGLVLAWVGAAAGSGPLGPIDSHDARVLKRVCRDMGLLIVGTTTDTEVTVVIARKPIESIVPRLEIALAEAEAAQAEPAIESATRTVAALGRELSERLALLTLALRSTPCGSARDAVIRQIRALVGR